jgi:CO/xanthine dehydrogenase FAD-binding subunit
MRSDPAQYELIAPATLEETLKLLSLEPGRYTPLAGGTELMVALNTGRLKARSLLSLHRLVELQFILEDLDGLHLGAATTFSDIRRHAGIQQHWPLLAQAASWTGSIANQNRGTLGGNLCNASPAADTPPVLLAYGASVTLVSVRGKRTLPYEEFHLSYKRTVLEPDELLFSVDVPRGFAEDRQYLRKVGTRNAQAISKVALAVVARLGARTLEDLRIGAASLADRPLRCAATEARLRGRSLGSDELEETVRAGRAALAAEAQPIDDIRSTARYRRAVALNLLEEFLRSF